jgi:hypothetical protein
MSSVVLIKLNYHTEQTDAKQVGAWARLCTLRQSVSKQTKMDNTIISCGAYISLSPLEMYVSKNMQCCAYYSPSFPVQLVVKTLQITLL